VHKKMRKIGKFHFNFELFMSVEGKQQNCVIETLKHIKARLVERTNSGNQNSEPVMKFSKHLREKESDSSSAQGKCKPK
jgi:hypothetical protein